MTGLAELDFRESRWAAVSPREILIDGKTLAELLHTHAQFSSPMIETCVSPVGWRPSDGDAPSHVRLLPEGPADFPCGRRAILVCRECGDFGCGALTVRIHQDDDGHIVWSDWLWQVAYDDSQHNDFGGTMPTWTFARDQYVAALHGHRIR